MLITWISVNDAMPELYRNVLVSGGLAYWDEHNWRTTMERDHRKIEWKVTHWAPLPSIPIPCPNCAALKEEIAELKSQIAGVCGFGR